ncbi:MAG: acyltransferase, partial [Actinobacteria bacterium]|nr:acyltransferase [Actinomycetota bacterium]
VFLVVQGIVAVVWVGTAMREEVLQAVLALTYTANWQLSFGHQPPYALVHLWSLSLEGQFYLLMAVGLWSLRRRLRRPDLVVAGLVLAAVAVALWRMLLYRHGVALPALYERTGARADSMFLGVAAAVAWRSRLVSDRTFRILGAAGLGFLCVAVLVAEPGAEWLFRGGFTVVAACAAAAVAAAATGAGVVARVGGVRVLRWVGAISYSLYLWHLPIYLWVVHAAPHAALAVKVGIAVPASFAAAWVSFRLIESRTLAPWRRTLDGDEVHAGSAGAGQQRSSPGPEPEPEAAIGAVALSGDGRRRRPPRPEP